LFPPSVAVKFLWVHISGRQFPCRGADLFRRSFYPTVQKWLACRRLGLYCHAWSRDRNCKSCVYPPRIADLNRGDVNSDLSNQRDRLADVLRLLIGIIVLVAMFQASSAPAAQNPAAAKPSKATNAATHPGRWVGGTYVFPTGPCTMIVKLGGSYWFTLPHDETRYYSKDIDTAKRVASAACDKWYANEMAGRLAVERANEELEKQHPTPRMADLSRALFTREGTLVCPSWEALEYASSSRDNGWKDIGANALFGVSDPPATSPRPASGQKTSAEFYGCSIYKDGVPVQMIEKSWRGAGGETSVGWLDPWQLRN